MLKQFSESVNEILLIAFLSFSMLCFDSCKNDSRSDGFQSSDKLKVTVYGAAKEVSGSLTLIKSGNKQYLIDCGLYYPEGEGNIDSRQSEAEEKNKTLPVEAKSIDALFVTHAHLDHIGRIPLLFEKGFNGKIYCTPATKIIMNEMLLEEIRYDNRSRNWSFTKNGIKTGYRGSRYVTAHWNNCPAQNNINPNNLKKYSGSRPDIEKNLDLSLSPCRLCAEKTLNEIIPYIESVDYNVAINADKYTNVHFEDAGHIPGSASVIFEINSGKGNSRKLLFSGDVGNSIGLLQNGPASVPQVDALWMETTYGNTKRPSGSEKEFMKFQEDVAGVINKKGIAWIPAFALDRTQKVLYLINDAKEKNIIPASVKVFCPSPTAFAVTEIYKNELTNKHGWFKNDLYYKQNAFDNFIRLLPEKLSGPCILITTSGMMDEAFSNLLLNELLPNTYTTVFLVGYQDPFSPGGQLLQNKKIIEWEDKKVEVNADVKKYGAFSAHADAGDLVKWLANQDKDRVKIFLVHGEPLMMKEQKENLEAEGFRNVFIPGKGEVLDFSVN